MCGITGILNFDGRPITEQALRVFNDSLTHRGPDGDGIWIDNSSGIGLGHRRLAIIDLSEKGKQPKLYRRRYSLTYNGEIYNYVELRDQLSAKGHTFESDSDADVLLAAYAEWGDKCLPKLNGMWAFALWDAQLEELTVCVDRFAIKSCVYSSNNNYFAFASEVKALLHLDRFELQMDESELYRRLFLNDQDNVDTVVEGVKRIPAGHLLKISRHYPLKLIRWWNTLEAVNHFSMTNGNDENTFLELLESSVNLRMRSDRSFGIPLSGGMDSSSILMLADKLLKNNHMPYDKIQTFHMIKQGSESEEASVDLLNHHAATQAYKIQQPEMLTYDMMRTMLYNNESVGLQSEGPYTIYRAMKRKGVVVSLDGHGADELIAGYHYYTSYAMKDALNGIPNFPRAMDIAAVRRRIARSGSSKSKLSNLLWNIKYINSERKSNYGSQTRTSLPHPSFCKQRSINPIFSLMDEDESLFREYGDHLNRKLYHEVHYGFLQRLLRTFDYSSMANGVEVRTPFLDWRLVCFMFSLPSKVKMGKGVNKLILRNSMKGLLPEPVRTDSVKYGFITRNKHYFANNEIFEWIGDMLSGDMSAVENLVHVQQVKKEFSLFMKSKNKDCRPMNFYRIAQTLELTKMYKDINSRHK